MGWLRNQLTKDLHRIPTTAAEAEKGFHRFSYSAMLLYAIATLQIIMAAALDVPLTAALGALVFAFGTLAMAQAYDMRIWYHRLSIA